MQNYGPFTAFSHLKKITEEKFKHNRMESLVIRMY